jgi:FkbM family methyltransferase
MIRSDAVRKLYGAAQRIPGLRGVARKTARAVIPRGSRLWIRVPRGEGKGFWMHADPRFDLGYINGDHEPWIQDLLRTELSQNDCYYDVGAHAGFFALIASRFVGPSGKIVAFEADPDIADALQANLDRNAIMQATVVRAAVWSSFGRVNFQPASAASNKTQGHIASGDTTLPSFSVPAVRLDDIVFKNGCRAPRLVKMDIEGAEWAALQGAARVFGEVKPKLLCEVHNNSQTEQIRTYLERFGYAVERWKPVHRHYRDYNQVYLWAIPR